MLFVFKKLSTRTEICSAFSVEILTLIYLYFFLKAPHNELKYEITNSNSATQYLSINDLGQIMFIRSPAADQTLKSFSVSFKFYKTNLISK